MIKPSKIKCLLTEHKSLTSLFALLTCEFIKLVVWKGAEQE